MPNQQMISKDELLLVHLSDIHFHKRSGGPFDLDEDLRLALETDTSEFIKNSGRSVDGILITGDIVYSGKRNEYEIAKKWLCSLCEIINCPEENVWTVPGNHDVDRDIINESSLIKNVHETLRLKNLCDIDESIEEYFSKDKMAKTLLHSPLGSYIEFNKLYEGCIIKDGSLYWEYPLPLNDKSRLIIRGLNTTLVSNSLDDDKKNKLILGLTQVQLPINDPSVAYLTLCHHTPDWLIDRDNVESFFNNRAMVQLFGHKHSQCIQKIDNSLRIVAGATHPERGDSLWLPRYNFLSIFVKKDINGRKLIVKIYPRKWNKDYTRFMADFDDHGSEVRTYELNLSDIEIFSDKSMKVISAPKENNELKCDEMVNESINQKVLIVNQHRKLVYRFYSLSFNLRYRIALDLNLVVEEDDGMKEDDLCRNIFIRAKDNDLLWLLWQKVEEAHGNDKLSVNPFKEL